MINREGLDIAAKNRTPQRRAIGVVGVSHVSSREGESFASPDEEGQTVAEATRGGRFSRREPPGAGEYRSHAARNTTSRCPGGLSWRHGLVAAANRIPGNRAPGLCFRALGSAPA